jgi:large subunit ribosomal protein L23
MTTMYEILLRPIVTEKTNYQATRLHQYTFEVRPEATRTMVREAVERIFKVTVLNVPAKRSRKGKSRRLGIRNPGYRKAIITLGAEDRLPIFEGVE